MTISLVPSISESRALGSFDAIRDKIRIAFRVAMIITFPCFMGLYCLAEKVAALFITLPVRHLQFRR